MLTKQSIFLPIGDLSLGVFTRTPREVVSIQHEIGQLLQVEDAAPLKVMISSVVNWDGPHKKLKTQLSVL